MKVLPLPESETQRHPGRYWQWLVAALVILGLAILLMRGWLFGGGQPTSERREVLTELSIAWMAKQELLRGQMFTEWNRYWFSGFPWLRYLSYPLYYTVAAISTWARIPLETTMIGFFLLALAGSGLAMFGYLERLLGDWRPALVGAVLYVAFPYHNHVGVETWIHAAFWVLLPLVLWTIELSRTAQGRRHLNYLLLTGILLGIFPVLSSEYTLLAGPLVAIYLALRELGDIRAGKRTWGQAVLGYLLLGLVALGTSCFFVLPGLLEIGYVGIHAKHGAATTFSNELLYNYSVTPRLVAYAIARRWRLPFDSSGLPGLLSSFWSVAWYPGIVAPPLALLGMVTARRQFAARLSLISLLLAALLSTGPTNGLNVFQYVPVLGRLSPFRGMLMVVAFVVILAAHGLARLLRHLDRMRWGRVPVLSWFLLIGALALLVLDFGPSASAYQVTEAYFTPAEREAYAWLDAQQNDAQNRLWEVAALPRDQYLRSYSLSQAPLLRLGGYYDNGAPLYVWQQNAWGDLHTRLRLHRVRYVLLREQETGADTLQAQLRVFGYRIVYQADGMQIWENPEIGDYAVLYDSVALDATQDREQPLRVLPEFVWRNIAMVTPPSYYLDDQTGEELQRYQYVLVDEPITRAPEQRQGMLQQIGDKMVPIQQITAMEVSDPARASIWYEHEDAGHIRLRVTGAEAGVLTVAEAWYPHWRVRVDSQEQPVLRTNWALLGVWLEPGDHQVEFHFQRPWYVYLGTAITASTCLALGAWWISCLSDRFRRSSRLEDSAVGLEAAN